MAIEKEPEKRIEGALDPRTERDMRRQEELLDGNAGRLNKALTEYDSKAGDAGTEKDGTLARLTEHLNTFKDDISSWVKSGGFAEDVRLTLISGGAGAFLGLSTGGPVGGAVLGTIGLMGYPLLRAGSGAIDDVRKYISKRQGQKGIEAMEREKGKDNE